MLLCLSRTAQECLLNVAVQSASQSWPTEMRVLVNCSITSAVLAVSARWGKLIVVVADAETFAPVGVETDGAIRVTGRHCVGSVSVAATKWLLAPVSIMRYGLGKGGGRLFGNNNLLVWLPSKFCAVAPDCQLGCPSLLPPRMLSRVALLLWLAAGFLQLSELCLGPTKNPCVQQ